MDQRVTDLELQVEELSEEIRYLKGELSRLRRLVVSNLGSTGGYADPEVASTGSWRSPGGARAASDSRSPGVERSFNPAASRSRTEGASASESGVSVRSISTSCSLSWGEREEICRQIECGLSFETTRG